MRLNRLSSALLLLSLLVGKSALAQQSTGSSVTQTNGVYPDVPFLLITPDARAGAMGEAGVAVMPDGNAMSINPAKLAFLEKPYGVSLSYSPWLKNLVPDINLAYLSGYYQLDDRTVIGASLRYFSLGEITLVDEFRNNQGTFSPNEFAIDATYSRRFGDNFSLGTTARYIRSNLTTGQIGGSQQKAGSAVAVDVSAFFKKPTVLFGKDAIVSAGLNLSNIGTKMSFAETQNKRFLPANMKLGGATTFIIDDYNQFTIALDFNKLMVPTDPIRDVDGNIISGKDPYRSVPSGILGSFGDAPGGFKEELKEVAISTGLEYTYNQQFAVRAGYFYENPQKGDRRYFTLGAGLKYNMFNLDFSYLVANAQNSPLANTLRFSLSWNIDKVGK
ncbi:type IX secretion system outer membrane channel protein PorV [Pedobacter chitinilyticus]|uniref:Type IX secretion system outer membrane channel protein PorV n=1 Tax=Pedobacter chitinilyticus TaxID=2233776 RepID=A0A3S3STF1_9SPHI|nr:type IX secretion system outer membrane channel protein PorV [Pedobacter chitinilyticus]RWU06189.1 type IX secretion system outer membrane channel protein PorV [Pedobacter chitinilyticus]